MPRGRPRACPGALKRERPERAPWLHAESLGEILAPGGSMAALFRSYEDRPAQRRMLGAVVRAFNEGQVSLIEAGTGTGKSLAYLVPSLGWAKEGGGPTVVSTNTINLQEQLAKSDLPLARSLLGGVRWAVLKGRGNYVSIRRALLAAEEQASLFQQDRGEELADIVQWSRETEDGSRSDLDRVPSAETWEAVKSDGDICLRSRCPHFEECHYQRARRRAAAAGVLVVNHSLLLSDLALRREAGEWESASVLPAYRKLVLDEAHHLEDAATRHLGVEVDGRALDRTFRRLDRDGRGLLSALHATIEDLDATRELRRRIEANVRPALERARRAVDAFFPRISREILRGSADRGAGVSGSDRQVRLGPRGIGEPAAAGNDFRELLDRAMGGLDELRLEIVRLCSRIEKRADTSDRGSESSSGGDSPRRVPIPENGRPARLPRSRGRSEDIRLRARQDPDRLDERMLDLRAAEKRLQAAVNGMAIVFGLAPEASAFVRWLALRGRGARSRPVLRAAPLRPGDVLAESLFSKIETVVMTSATLTTAGSFAYVRDRLGLSPDRVAERAGSVEELVVPSPFDYGTQTILGLPTDLTGVRSDTRRFAVDTAKVVGDLAEISGGGLLVLFTAYAALREAAALLRVDPRWRWPLLVQGEDSRSRLLRRFADSGEGVLMGTSSFWEGIDVPGPALRGVVLHKLPFLPPGDPVTRARLEAVEDAGGDAFREMSLPQAALRLKQGFGRLVRRRTDSGAVLVLDSRIVRMSYGRYLLDSLPRSPQVRGPWAKVRLELENFYR